MERDFRHVDYRKETVANLFQYGKSGSGVPCSHEAIHTTLRAISFSYKAHSDEVDVASADPRRFRPHRGPFFHAGCFGQMREHGYQRRQFDYVVESA